MSLLLQLLLIFMLYDTYVVSRYIKQSREYKLELQEFPAAFVIIANTSLRDLVKVHGGRNAKGTDYRQVSVTLKKQNDLMSNTATNHIEKLAPKLLSLILKEGRQQERHKQLFGGKLPPFIERIIQRVQNYFSVYNPPEYFDNSRPHTTLEDNIVATCTDNNSSCHTTIENTANLSNFQEAFNECDNDENDFEFQNCDDTSTGIGNCTTNEEFVNNNVETNTTDYTLNSLPTMSLPDNVNNIMVSQTVVQDSLVNIYSLASHSSIDENLGSKIIIILEPTMQENVDENCDQQNNCLPHYKPNEVHVFTDNIILNDTFKYGNTIYMKPEENDNVNYSIVIGNDRIEEYTDNLVKENANHSNNTSCEIDDFEETKSVNPIKTSSTTNTKCLTKSTNANSPTFNEPIIQPTRDKNQNENSVPNINLVLIPMETLQRNRTCFKNKPSNTKVEYYILKPDPGNINSKKNHTQKHETIDKKLTPSSVYLPSESSTKDYEEISFNNNGVTTPKNNGHTNENKFPILSKFPLIYRLFNKIHDQPRY